MFLQFEAVVTVYYNFTAFSGWHCLADIWHLIKSPYCPDIVNAPLCLRWRKQTKKEKWNVPVNERKAFILNTWQCFMCDGRHEFWNETKSVVQTFLCAVLLWGRWHWVSCSGKGTHYWQRAWPVIPGPGAERMDSVTFSFNECQGHIFFIIY